MTKQIKDMAGDVQIVEEKKEEPAKEPPAPLVMHPVELPKEVEEKREEVKEDIIEKTEVKKSKEDLDEKLTKLEENKEVKKETTKRHGVLFDTTSATEVDGKREPVIRKVVPPIAKEPPKPEIPVVAPPSPVEETVAKRTSIYQNRKLVVGMVNQIEQHKDTDTKELITSPRVKSVLEDDTGKSEVLKAVEAEEKKLKESVKKVEADVKEVTTPVVKKVEKKVEEVVRPVQPGFVAEEKMKEMEKRREEARRKISAAEKTVIIVEKKVEEKAEEEPAAESSAEIPETQEEVKKEETEVKEDEPAEPVEKKVTFSKDEAEIIEDKADQDTVVTDVTRVIKPVIFAPKREKSKAFSSAHSSLETFFRTNGKKTEKESPDRSPPGSPPHPDRRPSAPKVDIKARTKHLHSILFAEEPEKPPIQRTNKTWTRPTFGYVDPAPASVPAPVFPKAPAPPPPPQVAFFKEKEVIIEEKKPEIPVAPPPPRLKKTVVETLKLDEEAAKRDSSVSAGSFGSSGYEIPLPSSPPPPPPAAPALMRFKHVAVVSTKEDDIEKLINTEPEASTSAVISAYAKVEDQVEVTKEADKEETVEVTDGFSKEVQKIYEKEPQVENTVTVSEEDVDEEEIKEETEENVKKAYRSLIMPKVFSANKQKVSFKPVTPSPPKSPPKPRRKLHSPPPPLREPSPPPEPDLKLPSSPEALPPAVPTPMFGMFATMRDETNADEQVSKFNQEADEIIQSTSDLSPQEKAEMDEFFDEVEDVPVKVETNDTEEIKLQETTKEEGLEREQELFIEEEEKIMEKEIEILEKKQEEEVETEAEVLEPKPAKPEEVDSFYVKDTSEAEDLQVTVDTDEKVEESQPEETWRKWLSKQAAKKEDVMEVETVEIGANNEPAKSLKFKAPPMFGPLPPFVPRKGSVVAVEDSTVETVEPETTEIKEVKSVTEKSLKYEVIDVTPKAVETIEPETSDEPVLEQKVFQSQNLKYEVIDTTTAETKEIETVEKEEIPMLQTTKPIMFPINNVEPVPDPPHRVQINLDDADTAPVENIEKIHKAVAEVKADGNTPRVEVPRTRHVATVEISDDKVEARSLSTIQIDEYNRKFSSTTMETGSNTTTTEEATPAVAVAEDVQRKPESTSLGHVSKVQIDDTVLPEEPAATERHISSIAVDADEDPKELPTENPKLTPAPFLNRPEAEPEMEKPFKHITTVPLGNDEPPETTLAAPEVIAETTTASVHAIPPPKRLLGDADKLNRSETQPQPEVSVREPEVSVREPEVSVREPEVIIDSAAEAPLHAKPLPPPPPPPPPPPKPSLVAKKSFQMEAIKEEENLLDALSIPNGHVPKGKVEAIKKDVAGTLNTLQANGHALVSPQSS